MIADQDIRDAISSTALDRTLFVEAGAGTGKTSQLVERITNLVTTQGIRLANMAAITFTEAAATELRDRIRVSFEQLHGASGDDTTKERCRVALADVDLAAISTLHGFAQRILSEHPVESGLPPRIGVLDEIRSALERQERWERFVDVIHDDPAHEPLLMRAALLDIALERSYQHQTTVQDIATKLGEAWDQLDAVARLDHGLLPAVDFSPFDEAVAELEALPQRCSDHSDKFFCHLTGVLLPSMRSIAQISEPDAKLQALCSAPVWTLGKGGRAAAWDGDVKRAKADVTRVSDARHEVIGAACHDVLSRLMTLIAADQLSAAESRRREGRIEFHDLLVLAERLLVRSPSARASLHNRYTHLLLDEFQDTDPLQIRLAVLIASAAQGDHAPQWHQARVDQGRLFFVGDPKQSIYRFRRADISLFLAARERFGAGESLQRLSTNFRTIGPVISWLNAVFGELMANEVPGRQPRYEPLLEHRVVPAGTDHRPVLLGGPHSNGRAAEIREAEAADVAAAIAAIRHAPHEWPVLDHVAKQWRPARLSDITILIPTRTELVALQSALVALDVPYHLGTGTLVYDTQEVHDALSALRAIDDPSNELSLVAALRSPLYACSDTDLFGFHAAGGQWDLRKDAPSTLPVDHSVVEALAHLRSLWDQRWWRRPSALLAQLLHDRRAVVVALGSERPQETWSRLRFLVDQARSFEESIGGDLREFLQWADLQRSETVTVHEPVMSNGADDAVQVMTIHGSKGLEFPITILSGLSASPRKGVQGVSVIWDDDGLPAVALRKDRATANHGGLVDVENEQVRHEQTRLLYVASTRARDHLIVSCHHKSANGSFAEQLWTASTSSPESWRRLDLDGHRGSDLDARASVGGDAAGSSGVTPTAPTDRGRIASPQLEVGGSDVAGRDAWITHREELLAPQRQSRFISATSVATGIAVDDLADDEEPDSSGSADPGAVHSARRRGRAATAIGRAVHATLQLVQFDDPASVVAQAARQCELEAIPEMVDVVTAMVRSALESEAVQLARIHVSHREVYVAAPVGERVLEGYVDLLIETPQGLIVVDYKTDAVRTEAEIEEKLAAYEMQGAAYAVALEHSTGLAVIGCRFVFCGPHRALEREVADLAGAMAKVTATLGG